MNDNQIIAIKDLNDIIKKLKTTNNQNERILLLEKAYQITNDCPCVLQNLHNIDVEASIFLKDIHLRQLQSEINNLKKNDSFDPLQSSAIILGMMIDITGEGIDKINSYLGNS